MEPLIKQQGETAEKLFQLHTNYKKDGDSRKTIKYLESKIATLKSLYQEYLSNDNTIRDAKPTLDKNHPYLQARKEVLDTYTSFIAEMRHRLNSGPPTTPTFGRRAISECQNDDTPGPSIVALPDSDNLETASTSASDPKFAPSAPTKWNQDTSTGDIPSPVRKLFRQQDIGMRLLYRKLEAIKAKLASREYTAEYLKLKIHQLDLEVKETDQLHKAILMEVDDEDQFKYFTDDYYGTLTQEVESLIIKMQQELTKESTNPTSTSPVKLPKIELPTFHGEYDKWYAFNDVFTRLIHQNTQLSDTVKLTYLKSHIQKGAAQLIAHLPTIGENYNAAWEILQARYNNKRLLASSYFNAITSLPRIQHPSAVNIRSLHDTIIEMLHNINNLQLENAFEAIIAHLVLQKLDSDTLERYENSLECPREVPPLKNCLEFLLRRFQSLEACGLNKTINARAAKVESKDQRRVLIGTESGHQKPNTTNSMNTCSYCQNHGHLITRCYYFRNISIKKRIDFINRAGICTNCLLHSSKSVCDEKSSCATCKNRHHQLLHEPEPRAEKQVTIGTLEGVQTTLLATAVVSINSICDIPTRTRALIDPGSQVSLITEAAVRRLGLPLQSTSVNISGIGANNTNTANFVVTILLKPHFPSAYKLKVIAYVLPKITMDIPEQPIFRSRKAKWSNLTLADPEFQHPAPIDLLLGADVYSDFIGTQIIKGKPSALKTSLGWLISGPTQVNRQPQTAAIYIGKKSEQNMEKFWELEEIPNISVSESEQECENIFSRSTQRGQDGRYIVQIPFKEHQVDLLGQSRQRALQRFLQLEKKLDRNPNLKELYVNFMTTYIKLQHMKPVRPNKGSYYLPHHAVLQNTDTTKIRVVFDASMPTSTGLSLNDVMHIGHPLQNDLWAILLRWRQHRIVFTGDIEKMYRQIGMQEEHQSYQTIIWRENKQQPLQEYQLTTVTYGTSAAPYLAIRTLHQLAEDEFAQFPTASGIMKRDFYVDDVLTGADTIEEAQQLQSQLIKILRKGKMELGKWSSNHQALLTHIPEDKILIGDLTFTDELAIKTLGIRYNPRGITSSFTSSYHLTTTT